MVAMPPPDFDHDEMPPPRMPAPMPAPDMPAPNFGAIARSWTVTLERGDGQLQQTVADAVDPIWEGSTLTFRNADGKVVAEFGEDEVVEYSPA